MNSASNWLRDWATYTGGRWLRTQHALILLHGRLPEGAHIVATIHDEIVVECREQDAEEVLAMTKTAMLDCMKQLAKDCPVEVEGGIGKTWGSAK